MIGDDDQDGNGTTVTVNPGSVTVAGGKWDGFRDAVHDALDKAGFGSGTGNVLGTPQRPSREEVIGDFV
ncbi:MAG: hypothetical protein AAF035_07970 [Pseudomonadota bacterium]